MSTMLLTGDRSLRDDIIVPNRRGSSSLTKFTHLVEHVGTGIIKEQHEGCLLDHLHALTVDPLAEVLLSGNSPGDTVVGSESS